MLYTLVVSLIFSLILQFFIQDMVDSKRQLSLQKERLQAQLVIEIIKGKMTEKAGIIRFDKGICHYQKSDSGVRCEVEFSNGDKITLNS